MRIPHVYYAAFREYARKEDPKHIDIISRLNRAVYRFDSDAILTEAERFFGRTGKPECFARFRSILLARLSSHKPVSKQAVLILSKRIPDRELWLAEEGILTGYADGSYSAERNKIGIGGWLQDIRNLKVTEWQLARTPKATEHSSLVAEIQAFKRCIDQAFKHRGASTLILYVDCKALLTNPQSVGYAAEKLEAGAHIETVIVCQVPREYNKEADRLAAV